ncbi:MAG: ectonucleotide pyrophosphatase/phosphodiesterase, partial [Chloroflexota bacterium]
TPAPTPTATRVVDYVPTATKTPTPLPSPTPTTTSLPPAPAVATSTPIPARTDISHVVIISIDGLRPDALDVAEAPFLDDLRARGAYSPRAQTVSLSITLPGHASMLTGMTPDKHGILWGVPYIGWPGMNGPSLFSVAHEAGLSTAMVFGKEKLHYLVLPNSVDTLWGADMSDTEVKQRAVEVIEAGLPHVLFVHFPDTDRVGHSYGWLSANQLQSIAFVDSLIGEIVAALERGGYQNSTLLLITADHGGHGTSHGDDSPEDRTIPWLAVGPGVRPGVTLTITINTYDTAATAAYALKLPIPEHWDGRPALEIFE